MKSGSYQAVSYYLLRCH